MTESDLTGIGTLIMLVCAIIAVKIVEWRQKR